jgi:hypothetical protein
MAQDDYAILVGIARYRDASTYPPLAGPLHDLQRVQDWLQSEGVPEQNITIFKTHEVLLDLQLAPQDQLPAPLSEWAPNYEDFASAFTRLVQDPEHGGFRQRQGRLYLYLSGHGFSMFKGEKPSAALYAANTYGIDARNIAGTLYADAVRQGALFSEVVLIMDCCRDPEFSMPYDRPGILEVEDDGAERVRVLQVYAAPKGGKAQERVLQDADGKPVGLLTHGWLKALAEAPTDVAGRVSSTILKSYLDIHWTTWFDPPLPAKPRLLVPESGDIFFQSPKPLCLQTFALAEEVPIGALLELRSAILSAVGTVQEHAVHWIDNGGAWQVSVGFDPQSPEGRRAFGLLLPGIEHVLHCPGRPHPAQTFIPEAGHVLHT